MMKDSMFMKAKDVSIIIGIVTILGYLFRMSSHVTHWDDVVSDMAVIKPIIAADTAAIALLQSHYVDIKDDLAEIKKNTR
jgi:hypothetical protein